MRQRGVTYTSPLLTSRTIPFSMAEKMSRERACGWLSGRTTVCMDGYPVGAVRGDLDDTIRHFPAEQSTSSERTDIVP